MKHKTLWGLVALFLMPMVMTQAKSKMTFSDAFSEMYRNKPLVMQYTYQVQPENGKEATDGSFFEYSQDTDKLFWFKVADWKEDEVIPHESWEDFEVYRDDAAFFVDRDDKILNQTTFFSFHESNRYADSVTTIRCVLLRQHPSYDIDYWKTFKEVLFGQELTVDLFRVKMAILKDKGERYIYRSKVGGDTRYNKHDCFCKVYYDDNGELMYFTSFDTDRNKQPLFKVEYLGSEYDKEIIDFTGYKYLDSRPKEQEEGICMLDDIKYSKRAWLERLGNAFGNMVSDIQAANASRPHRQEGVHYRRPIRRRAKK